MMRGFLIVLLIFAAGCSVPAPAPAPAPGVDVGDLLGRIAACLTPDGRIDYDRSTHVIVVTDTADVHERVARIVADAERGVVSEGPVARWSYRLCPRPNAGYWRPSPDDACGEEVVPWDTTRLAWRSAQRHGWYDVALPREAVIGKELPTKLYKLVDVKRPLAEEPEPDVIR